MVRRRSCGSTRWSGTGVHAAWRPLIDKAFFCLTSFPRRQPKQLPSSSRSSCCTPHPHRRSRLYQLCHKHSAPCQTVTPPRPPQRPNSHPHPGAQGRDPRLARARRPAAASNGSKSPPPPMPTTRGATTGAQGTMMTRAAPLQDPAIVTTTAATPETATTTGRATAETGTAIATETARRGAAVAPHGATGTTDPKIGTGTGTLGHRGAKRRTNQLLRPLQLRRRRAARR